jgi:hypothetical protein
MAGEHPSKQTIQMAIPGRAAGADGTQIIGLAKFAGVLSSVKYVPAAAVTGADVESRKVAIVNKGQAGAGTTEMAALTFANTVNGVAYDSKDVTLSVTAANKVTAEGDVLAFVSMHIGATGLADPGGYLEVTIDKTV